MKISELPKATFANDGDVLPIVQDGETKQVPKDVLVPQATNEAEGIMKPGNGFTAIDGVLQTANYELLNDITLEEDVSEVMRERDDQGSSFKLRKFLLIFIGKIPSGSDFRLRMRANGGVIYMTDQVMQFPADGKAHVFWVAAEKYADGVFLSRYPNKFIDLNDVDDMLVVQGAYQETTACKSNLCLYYPPKIPEQKDITKWHFHTDNETDKLLAGSRILVWGVRE